MRINKGRETSWFTRIFSELINRLNLEGIDLSRGDRDSAWFDRRVKHNLESPEGYGGSRVEKIWGDGREGGREGKELEREA